MPKHVFTKT